MALFGILLTVHVIDWQSSGFYHVRHQIIVITWIESYFVEDETKTLGICLKVLISFSRGCDGVLYIYHGSKFEHRHDHTNVDPCWIYKTPLQPGEKEMSAFKQIPRVFISSSTKYDSIHVITMI